jgi:hypothetical protein
MMKPEHLKLARIVTVVCGGMSSLGAGAMGSDSPMVTSGRIIPLLSAPQGSAVDVTDVTLPDKAPVTAYAMLDSAPALDIASVPVESSGGPAVASAESDDAHAVKASIALSGDATPVTVSLASNVADVADTMHVADVADGVDVPHVAKAADVVDVQDVAKVADVADVPRVAAVADVVDVPHVAEVADAVDVPSAAKVAKVVELPHVTPAAPVADVPTPPATAQRPRDQAVLKLGSTVDVITMAAHRIQSADTGTQTPDVAVEHQADAVTPRAAKIDDADPAWASADLVAVNENRLDDMRGGFDAGSGLVVSFGITREAFVNGNLVTSTSFNIPNIAQMTPQQAQMLMNANAGALVQNGLGNTVQPGGLPGVTGAVIQNTLSNQQIQALTTINTTVNSLSAFKSMNLGQTLNSALIGAVRTR